MKSREWRDKEHVSLHITGGVVAEIREAAPKRPLSAAARASSACPGPPSVARTLSSASQGCALWTLREVPAALLPSGQGRALRRQGPMNPGRGKARVCCLLQGKSRCRE